LSSPFLEPSHTSRRVFAQSLYSQFPFLPPWISVQVFLLVLLVKDEEQPLFCPGQDKLGLGFIFTASLEVSKARSCSLCPEQVFLSCRGAEAPFAVKKRGFKSLEVTRELSVVRNGPCPSEETSMHRVRKGPQIGKAPTLQKP
jgi:hypothetical protein